MLNFIRVLRSHPILPQIWYVTFQMMKFLGLLIGLQTFAVVLNSFWKHAVVICRTVNSVPRKTYIWSVEDNSYRRPDRTMKIDSIFGSNQCELPRCKPWKASDCEVERWYWLLDGGPCLAITNEKQISDPVAWPKPVIIHGVYTLVFIFYISHIELYAPMELKS